MEKAGHPETVAKNQLLACADAEVDTILCAIGGDDMYRLLSYLFDGDALKNVLSASSNKIFLGFSDTTTNHFMLHTDCRQSPALLCGIFLY